MNTKKLTRYIGLAMVLGVLVGYLCNKYAQNAQEAKQIASYFSLITDIFLRMIKMIIAPLVFATLVSGLASMSDASAVGRIGLRAMFWFITASAISLLLGLMLVNVFQPGAHLNLALPDTSLTSGLKTGDFTLKTFITHVFPKSIAEAMANNEILQILVFSLFFGAALSFIRGKGHNTIFNMIDELAKIMFRVTDYVMRFAPLGVFAAMAAAITTEGLGVLVSYGKLIGEFYLGLALLWAILFAVGYLFLGKSTFRLGGLIKEPTLLAFSTASSESAYPKTIEALSRFGVSKRISGFVLPLGYSFNLDGSMMYQSFAVLFIAQAYNIEMSFSQQLTLLLVLMVTSKGMAGVARASLVVVAATLPMFHLPEAGLLLIMGIDQFFDMGRTATNVVGNSLATAVIAKMEGGEDDPTTVAAGEAAAPQAQEAPAKPASQACKTKTGRIELTPEVGRSEARARRPEFGIAPGSGLSAELDAVVIVVTDVPPDTGLQLLDALEAVQVEELGFKRAEEAFHGGIVQAVSLAGHALRHRSRCQHAPVVRLLVLPTLVRVQNRPIGWSKPSQRLFQHAAHELEHRPAAGLVGHDLTVVQVHHR